MARPRKSAAADDAARPSAPVAPAPPLAAAPAPAAAQAPAPVAAMGSGVPAFAYGAPVPPPPAGASGASGRQIIDVDNFVRMRNSFIAGLVSLQDLIKNFATDYLRQTNMLIGEPILETDALAGGLAGLNHLGTLLQPQPDSFVPVTGPGAPGLAPALAAAGPGDEKKERRKRVLDPNAPKRPLTPFFLYMQSARPIIANDLGPDHPKHAVPDEGQRRWAAMTGQEKAAWHLAYQYNMRLYNARVASYKAGNPDARDMTDAEALAYADEHDIPAPPLRHDVDAINDHDAIANQLRQHPSALALAPDHGLFDPSLGAAAFAPMDDEPVDLTEPVPALAAKAPKKPGRKRKSAVDDVLEPQPPSDLDDSPARKRKRAVKAAPEPEKEVKRSGRKKKA